MDCVQGMEDAPGLVRVREGAEAETKGPSSWPGLSHPTSRQLGALELQGDGDPWEPLPDLALATYWPRGPDQLRQVSCAVPTHLPLCSRCQTGSPGWLATDGSSSEKG